MKLVPLQKHQKKKLRVSELAQPFSSVQFSSESRADQNWAQFGGGFFQFCDVSS